MAIVSQDRSVALFDGIELDGVGTIHLTEGPKTALRVDADADTIDKIAPPAESARTELPAHDAGGPA